jgi:hypothetical protein
VTAHPQLVAVAHGGHVLAESGQSCREFDRRLGEALFVGEVG